MAWLVLVLLGAALWWWSIALTLRAYPGEQMPMWGNPSKAPQRAVALRSVGAAAVVFGIAMASPSVVASGWMAAVFGGMSVFVLLLAPYLVAVTVHNRRIGAHP